MDFDYLAKLSPAEFEAERARILNEHIAQVPLEHRENAQALQDQLDLDRKSMSSLEFLESLTFQMRENMDNICDQFQVIASIVQEPEAVDACKLTEKSSASRIRLAF